MSTITPATQRLAPADRVPGRRGVRGWLAAALLVAAVGALYAVLGLWRGSTSGSLGIGGATVIYDIDGPSGLGPSAAVAALALAGSSLLLWSARRAPLLALGALLAVGGLAAGALGVGRRLAPAGVARAAVRALPLGVSRGAVEDALGVAPGAGTYRSGSRRLDCLVYLVRAHAEDKAALCFDGDRLSWKGIG